MPRCCWHNFFQDLTDETRRLFCGVDEKKKGEKKRAPVPARDVRKPVADRGAGGHKKPGTDRAPEREHRQMPGLQGAFELMVGCVSVGRTADFVLSVVSTATLGGILGANHSPKDRKISINVG